MSLFRRRRLALEREAARIAHDVLGDGVPVIPRPEIDAIVIDDVQVNLSALRPRYRDLDADEAHRWLESSLIDLLTDETPDRDRDRSALLPALRSQAFLEAHRLSAQLRGVPHRRLAARAITESVVVGLVWERPHSMVSLAEAVLESWGMSYEDVLGIAVENLTAQPMVGWVGSDDRVFRLVTGDDFGSARLLGPDVFRRLPFGDDIVVCAPTRTDLFVAAADDPRGLIDMFDASLRASQQGSVVSLRPLRFSAGTWSELHLEADHPAYLAWRMLTRLDWAKEADRTRSLLQDLVGSGMFVSSLIVREDESSGVTDTVSVWSEGVPTLLAAADLVSFPRSDRDSAFVTAPWNRVVDVLSDRMERTEHYPERWLVESFPSNAELARLVSP